MTRRYLTAPVLRGLEQQLTERDISLLKSVSDLRFVSGSQLQRLHFDSDDASARATRRALLRLIRLEVLSRLDRSVGGVRAGSAGFVYCLGIAGQKLAMQHGFQRMRRGRRSRSPGTLFLGHCLDVAELHTQLIEADRSHRLELIELAAEPVCHRQYAGLGSQRVLKPDSYLRFGLGEFDWSYFIEIDRGTEGSRAIERKLKDYLRYEASGIEQAERGVFPKVLWSVPDEARAEVIRTEIEQLAPPSRELFGTTLFKEVIHTLSGMEK